MSSIGSRVLSMVCEDPEIALASFSGSVTDALLHPRGLRKLIPYLMKALIAGYLLAKFVSPGIAERFRLTEKEALAVSFICGYAGVRLLTMSERALEKKIESLLAPHEPPKTQLITTDSSKDSGDSTGVS